MKEKRSKADQVCFHTAAVLDTESEVKNIWGHGVELMDAPFSSFLPRSFLSMKMIKLPSLNRNKPRGLFCPKEEKSLSSPIPSASKRGF